MWRCPTGGVTLVASDLSGESWGIYEAAGWPASEMTISKCNRVILSSPPLFRMKEMSRQNEDKAKE